MLVEKQLELLEKLIWDLNDAISFKQKMKELDYFIESSTLIEEYNFNEEIFCPAYRRLSICDENNQFVGFIFAQLTYEI